MSAPVYLATVALEPTRWSRLNPKAPKQDPIVLSEWLDRIAEAGFDGIEVWEPHLTSSAAAEADAVRAHRLPVPIYNSYVSLDDPDPAERLAVAREVTLARSRGVKFNVGNDPSSEAAYAERIEAWLTALPADTALICECHSNISIADVSEVAARIFDAAAPAGRLQALVHTHDDADLIRACFDAYGDRITHVHVNFLDFVNGGAPKLADIGHRIEPKVALLRELGFEGSWTIEFVHGLLTDNDKPAFLLDQAIEDLGVLRSLLGTG